MLVGLSRGRCCARCMYHHGPNSSYLVVPGTCLCTSMCIIGELGLLLKTCPATPCRRRHGGSSSTPGCSARESCASHPEQPPLGAFMILVSASCHHSTVPPGLVHAATTGPSSLHSGIMPGMMPAPIWQLTPCSRAHNTPNGHVQRHTQMLYHPAQHVRISVAVKLADTDFVLVLHERGPLALPAEVEALREGLQARQLGHRRLQRVQVLRHSLPCMHRSPPSHHDMPRSCTHVGKSCLAHLTNE